jgi:GNAT superfamily N-acetyltransferase
MNIRNAQLTDGPTIEALLHQLGYPDTGNFLPQKLERMLVDPDERLLVGEAESGIVGFISIHFIPQIAIRGDFARISYFCIADGARGKGFGQEMEEFVVSLARERHCDRIEVHCHWQRSDAHRFYSRQGFEESPKYLIKKLP